MRKHLAACLVIAAALGTTIALLAQAPATPASAAKKGAPAGLFGRGGDGLKAGGGEHRKRRGGVGDARDFPAAGLQQPFDRSANTLGNLLKGDIEVVKRGDGLAVLGEGL